jgi:putative Ca2+/H+ antiporter (TMEM165/GDT1 family)
VGFLVFAVLAARRDADEELKAERAAVVRAGWRQRLPWLASFLVVFAAEWGDLTQLATAALVAETREPLSVAIGATAAMWAVTVVAAVAGARLARSVAPSVLKWASAALFAAVGLVVLASAVVGG